MSGYTKLFASIVDSTVWREPDSVRLVWITMLAKADRDGVVESSIPGLADAARVSLEQCLAALDRLKGPDEYSRTREHEGRRIEEVDGGWVILNHAKYRERMTLDQLRSKQAERQRKYRERKKLQEPTPRPAAAQPPNDFDGSPNETTCPLDIAQRAEAVVIPELVKKLPGATVEQVRDSVQRCVAHYTIGPGMGQRRRHWLRIVRGWVTKDHGDKNLTRETKKPKNVASQLLERAERLSREEAEREAAQ